MSQHKYYYPYFDLLRFTLAFIVMAGHDKLIPWGPAPKVAVDAFFALSGWLIAGILLELKPENLSRFYYNRVMRIWIPYYLGLIFILLVSLLKDSITIKWFEILSYKIFFVYNLFGTPQLENFRNLMPLSGTGSHFWSVNAEEQFYLLSPILLVVANPKIGRNLLYWSIFALVLYATDQNAGIAFGVIAAILNKRYPDFHLKTQSKIILSTIFAFSATGFLLGFMGFLMSPLIAISTVLLLAIRGKPNKVWAFLGGLSYQLYLNHWIGVYVANFALSPFGLRDTLIRRIVACIISIAFAGVLYVLIDKNIQKKRDTLYTANLGKICMSASYVIVGIGILIGLILFIPSRI